MHMVAYRGRWSVRVIGKDAAWDQRVIILLVVLDALDLAALRWGFNSNDGMNGPEWERRQRWYGFH